MTTNADTAVAKALATRQINRAVEHLMGLVEGMIADRALHDLEIQMLSTWAASHPEVVRTWPGFVVARKLAEILEDGVVSDAERRHLVTVLTELSGNEFALTGSADPEVTALPINDAVSIDLKNMGVCHSGEFIFGTRAACERLTLKAGGMPLDNVSKSADILVIGTRLSPNWAHTSFGRKIQKAAELQDEGHPIEIISERRWIEAVGMGTPA